MAVDNASPVLDTTREAFDIDSAGDVLRQVASGVTIREADSAFSLYQRTLGDERLRLTRLRTTGFLHAHVDVSGYVAVGRISSGGVRARCNDSPLDVSAPFLLTPGSAETWSSTVEADAIGLDLAALGMFTGRDLTATGRFPHSGALSRDLQDHWESTIAHVGRIFDDDTLLRNDLIRQAAVDAVFAATVSTFGIEAETADAVGGSAAVARATDFVDDHLGEPLSVADIAAAARLSVRGLQSAFQRTLGVTPASYVRTARLAAVHRDLQKADADGTTVAEIARRWGFAHLPRFAQHYRTEFGELPHETLRR
ncbi:helix-turn-helix transcriptional regulator [Microbacterium oleivorans]|uniref:Transcriptional regulator, AraC family n=1 Tax=Microbacterium oleivorans TaxID=273677 RepID=A0A031FTM4_9MICO|nr:helix-turn-helix transcriptional regulator [Microbacterium oleivorans]AZS44166.1 HTH-type transcriptional activator RhaS [Microbacterium oleivorans]EZP26990.1 Transcriptional regulator, AraC family [Microbacterium oleivorans]THE06049.1 AraC family transcriptional regulator [Microbacterium oleivorans]